MSILETFSALRRVRSPRVIPALLAALDAEGHDSLRTHAVRMLAASRDESAHRALLYRYTELPVEAQAAVRSAAHTLRGVIREALQDRAAIREVALRILEDNRACEIADLLAEFLSDERHDLANRAETALKSIVAAFLAERAEADEPLLGPDGEPRRDDTRKLRHRAKILEQGRLLFRAMAVATERLPESGRGWIVEACLQVGGECRTLLNEALRVERERREPGPVEHYLSQDSGVRTLEYLLDRLVDHRAEIRAVAARALGCKRGAEVNANLAWVLDERVPEERLYRILNIWDGVPFLDVMDGHADRYASRVVRRILGLLERIRIEDADKARVFAVLAEHPDREIQAACLTALQGLPAARTGQAFLRLARGKRGDAALQAFQTLVRRNHSGTLKVAAALLDAPWANVRDEAARFIATRAYQRYREAFDAMTEEQRRQGGEGLRHVDDGVIAELQHEITAAEPVVRLRALRMLDLTSNAARVGENVLALMRDPDARVRATVVGMLARLRSAEAVKAIGALLDDPDRRVRANAVEAIESLGDRALARVLVPHLQDQDNRIRANAAKALYTLGIQDAAEIMRGMLNHDQPLMRMSAAWALGEARPPGAREWLQARLKVETDEGVRRRAQASLERLKPEAAAG
jgi:HEAT repeat protein